jgi:uncharacterized membrane protein
MSYLLLKWLHVVGAMILMGTGTGIAFFLWRAHRTRDPRIIAVVVADVVRADVWFTATAVLLQPITGLMLMGKAGWAISQAWLWQSLLVYVLVGCCWLPVVQIQGRMRDLAREAVAQDKPLPAEYFRCFRWWCLLGWPGFTGVLLIAWFMVSKQGL